MKPRIRLAVLGLIAGSIAVGMWISQTGRTSRIVGAFLPNYIGAAKAAAASGANWSVATEIDEDNPISDRRIVVARMEHLTAAGGKIAVKATCPTTSSIRLEFDSFGRDNKAAAYEYASSDNDRVLGIIYREDLGHQLFIINRISRTGYVNSAEAEFGHVETDYAPADIDQAESQARQPGDQSGSVGGALRDLFGRAMIGLTFETAAEGVQDIIPFLSAKRVRFQLPLMGGRKEIVEIAPQDASFQSFLSQCRIDPRRMRQAAHDAAVQAARAREEERRAAALASLKDASLQRARRDFGYINHAPNLDEARKLALKDSEYTLGNKVAAGTMLKVIPDGFALDDEQEAAILGDQDWKWQIYHFVILDARGDPQLDAKGNLVGGYAVEFASACARDCIMEYNFANPNSPIEQTQLERDQGALRWADERWSVLTPNWCKQESGAMWQECWLQGNQDIAIDYFRAIKTHLAPERNAEMVSRLQEACGRRQAMGSEWAPKPLIDGWSGATVCN